MEGVQKFGQLKAEETFGIEPGDAVAAIEAWDFADGERPQIVDGLVGLVDVTGQLRERLALGSGGVDPEVLELFMNELLYCGGGGGGSTGAELFEER